MARPKKTEVSVTLRQISNAQPCWDQYSAFLKDMKCNLIPNGVAENRATLEGCRVHGFKTLRKPAYGPDDLIPMANILRAKATRGAYKPCTRVRWLLHNVPGLEALASRIEAREQRAKGLAQAQYLRVVERADEERAKLQAAAHETAIREVLAA